MLDYSKNEKTQGNLIPRPLEQPNHGLRLSAPCIFFSNVTGQRSLNNSLDLGNSINSLPQGTEFSLSTTLENSQMLLEDMNYNGYSLLSAPISNELNSNTFVTYTFKKLF